ncbi:tryptophan--tRNA ligase [Actinosynnema mirum]|uniref:Tryptophan--tRNA ligase n=1 Tax=Actinosynnema mirum (strain ATCC 29888 / DSM 43827 / JCM 3225 / NBRC 14064 / NCIMB 13271 / NRRL B-12336 / IMRU 3971 / 101) TaxID=446462 RepID=C6WKW3_ACTMD|nr:tryptophan--tRNA ligase [Actinosynnema mirum]ACU34718.1 tryptophanyl-tRNA synthetase [Actinosynnema mirum DSM 43827]
MTRLSAITPSGHVQLGNHLGAVRRWAREGTADDLYFISDLHAMTTPHNPSRLRALTREQLAVAVAAGVDPASVFVQSDLVRELGALTWVLECVCSYGEAARMIQFKEKSTGRDSVRLSLLTYPVLMAADILLQGADEVPVGEDQAQHVELARVLARRFNGTYGEVFAVPSAVVPRTAARVRDLADPSRKMAKSAVDAAGTVFVLDPPDLVRRKIQRAVTDRVGVVRHDPEGQPGVSNLLEITAACTGKDVGELAAGISSYAELKETAAEAVVEELRGVREGALALLEDAAELDRVRAEGAERARERSRHRLDAALRMSGLG